MRFRVNRERTMKKRMDVWGLNVTGRLSDRALRELVCERVAPVAVDRVNWPEYPYVPRVTVRVAHAMDALVLLFDVEEAHVRAATMEERGAVWEDSCVEFFVADPVGEGYYNFEVNCIGTGLAAHRFSRDEATCFTDEQMARWRRFGSLGHEPVDARGETSCWWMMEVIPFSLLGVEEMPESLRVNFYKCGNKCDRPHYLSWSPIDAERPDFHRPEFFGTMVLHK